jgi:hypothetical protein
VAVSTEYVQTSLRLPVPAKATLDAVAALEGRSQSAVLEAALAVYVKSLPPAARQAIETMRTGRLSRKLGR